MHWVFNFKRVYKIAVSSFQHKNTNMLLGISGAAAVLL